MRAEIAAREGDRRLNLLFGLAAWFLFLDHVPHNAMSALTLRNFGFSGATDLFVFVAGYTAAITYGKMMSERGFVVAATRIFRRVWQLYAAYVVLFVVYINLIGYVARQSAAPELIHEFNVTGILGHTIRTLVFGLLLQAKPLNLDVLQLLIVLMAFFPIVLLGMLRRPNLTLGGSVLVYLASRHFGWNLPSYPDGHWYFNPYSWQLLFVLGGWFGPAGVAQKRAIARLQELWPLRVAALLCLLFALVVTAAGHFPELHEVVPESLLRVFLPNDKEDLAIYRLLHFLALAFLFSRLVPRNWPGFQSVAVQPVIKCGEEWLPVFCAGVFLSFAGHLVLITGPNSIAMHILVSVAGIAVMTAVAYYASWSRRQDYKPALSAQHR